MKMEPKKVTLKKDFKEVQQDATELNGDGNRTRGRYGEDLEEVVHDCLLYTSPSPRDS